MGVVAYGSSKSIETYWSGSKMSHVLSAEMLIRVIRFDSLRAHVPAVAAHLPCIHAIQQAAVQQTLDLSLGFLRVYRCRYLHTPSEVAAHPVGATNVVQWVASIHERVNAVMLEETPHDTDHAHVVAQPRHARS
eukprot:CAMPEP_0206126924 /NCGR_PEP_ID=MMETSP1472-20131121/24530_1 /ASSEMBLY_ACC=CAM_ASM_001108 /TAXON_ID=41880 /ORGANISM="Pycnococcus provasolii, Strain RCC251" /LENGTH=133 /DNA_ID=CAMNT_0053517983 /DNA_START=165 /DNA_END=565 /DNA_ORIENTATION=-